MDWNGGLSCLVVYIIVHTSRAFYSIGSLSLWVLPLDMEVFLWLMTYNVVTVLGRVYKPNEVDNNTFTTVLSKKSDTLSISCKCLNSLPIYLAKNRQQVSPDPVHPANHNTLTHTSSQILSWNMPETGPTMSKKNFQAQNRKIRQEFRPIEAGLRLTRI